MQKQEKQIVKNSKYLYKPKKKLNENHCENDNASL